MEIGEQGERLAAGEDGGVPLIRGTHQFGIAEEDERQRGGRGRGKRDRRQQTGTKLPNDTTE